MASKVRIQVLGGQEQVIDSGLNTVGDAKRKVGALNHTASVNGEPASDDEELEDYAYVSLAPAVKGA